MQISLRSRDSDIDVMTYPCDSCMKLRDIDFDDNYGDMGKPFVEHKDELFQVK